MMRPSRPSTNAANRVPGGVAGGSDPSPPAAADPCSGSDLDICPPLSRPIARNELRLVSESPTYGYGKRREGYCPTYSEHRKGKAQVATCGTHDQSGAGREPDRRPLPCEGPGQPAIGALGCAQRPALLRGGLVGRSACGAW